MYYFVIFFSTALFSVGLLFIRQAFFSFSLAAASQLDVIIDYSIDEQEKQRRLIKKLKGLLIKMIAFFGLFFLVTVTSLIPSYLYLLFESIEVSAIDTNSVYFFLAMLCGGLIIIVFPLKKRVDYSELSILLHKMILDNYNISKVLFGLEKRIFGKKKALESKKFVVVTGLARAGTTALTNLLFQSNSFYSLSYANMPFLLSVNLWSKIYRPKKSKLKERAHGDQVLFGYDSIEALDEHFFKVFLNDEYIHDSSLEAHEVDEPIYTSYMDYQKLIGIKSNNKIYLTKNNNMILRYESLRKYNREFVAIVMFRNPVDHATSLLNQHERFSEMQRQNPFSVEYMNWLGHHEFGLNQKVFDFGLENIWDQYEKTSLEYWLAIWTNYYTNLLSLTLTENLLFVSYDDLLSKPKKLVTAISNKSKIPMSAFNCQTFKKTVGPQSNLGQDIDLLERSKKIHGKLIERQLTV